MRSQLYQWSEHMQTHKQHILLFMFRTASHTIYPSGCVLFGWCVKRNVENTMRRNAYNINTRFIRLNLVKYDVSTTMYTYSIDSILWHTKMILYSINILWIGSYGHSVYLKFVKWEKIHQQIHGSIGWIWPNSWNSACSLVYSFGNTLYEETNKCSRKALVPHLFCPSRGIIICRLLWNSFFSSSLFSSRAVCISIHCSECISRFFKFKLMCLFEWIINNFKFRHRNELRLSVSGVFDSSWKSNLYHFNIFFTFFYRTRAHFGKTSWQKRINCMFAYGK